MKTNILLLIAAMIIFSGCSLDEDKVVSGSCVTPNYGAIYFGTPGATYCYITAGEAACSEKSKGNPYTFTPNGSCSK